MKALILVALSVIVVACGSSNVTPTSSPAPSPSGPAPVPTWPVPAEVLPDATSSSPEALLTCGGRTFPRAGLDAPTGAQGEQGPTFDALRAALVEFGAAFPGAPTWAWRLAGQDDTGAVFLARTDALGPPGWVAVEVTADASGWHPVTMGQCDPQVVLSADFGPATWALDPAFPAPTPSTTDLHVLVWETACSNGSPATGRISAPVIAYTATTVTITLGVRPLTAAPGEAFACPMPPGTPATLRLTEPLGTRTLLDGGHVPPVPPSPANG